MKKVILGIRRDLKKFFFTIFLSYSVIWTIIEPIISFFSLTELGITKFITFILLSLVVGIIRSYPQNNIKFKIKNTNTNIEIKFGDLFKQNGNIVIAVNEYFDSQIGKPVSKNSLHGIFINQILGGKTEIFDNAIEKELGDLDYKINNRSLGKNKQFKIGTTAVLKFGEKKYFLFALSKTNDNFKAYCNPEMFLNALNGLWNKVRNESNGEDLNIALVGTGLSGVGLPPMRIIELILISILQSTKISELNKKINIILHNNYFEEIDLKQIKNYWRD